MTPESHPSYNRPDSYLYLSVPILSSFRGVCISLRHFHDCCGQDFKDSGFFGAPTKSLPLLPDTIRLAN